MAIDKETVDYVAHLARIDLKSEESDKLAGQLKDILGFIDKLANLDTKDIPPTSHILPINNILRQDTLKESLPIERTIENAPEKNGNFFVVPKIIE
ncbi:MAG: Asp-tRNA(Asn)/Glu-tRNA(Gln) amidotransferase subunit GatC [Candidatus Omnitrophica bacterium]|nr:Asp-tRNA(Asn)/Glu-tRNA(Gln) amidotransferase subunit GatC [Candidatus Omnitrophota bacterium]